MLLQKIRAIQHAAAETLRQAANPLTSSIYGLQRGLDAIAAAQSSLAETARWADNVVDTARAYVDAYREDPELHSLRLRTDERFVALEKALYGPEVPKPDPNAIDADHVVRLATELIEKVYAPQFSRAEAAAQLREAPELVHELAEALKLTKRPVLPQRSVVFAEPVEGTEGGFLVTLDCGHKIASRARRITYGCPDCPPQS